MSESTKTMADVVRIDKLIENLSGCEDIAAAIIDEFFTQAEAQLCEVEAALATRDCGLIAAASHKFKGSLGSIHAGPSAEVAGAIELAAQRKDLAGVQSHGSVLRASVEELFWHLRRWREATGAALDDTPGRHD